MYNAYEGIIVHLLKLYYVKRIIYCCNSGCTNTGGHGKYNFSRCTIIPS
jgi:hypothetical protein